MRQPLLFLSFLILTLAVLSCTKTKSPGLTSRSDTASIIGTWTWAFQSKTLWDHSGLPSFTPATTGIDRTLTFDSSGKFTFIHNDSIFRDTADFDPLYLFVAVPIRLLPAVETDTGSYRLTFGIVGCSFQDTTELIMQDVPYQALLSADTLLVHLNLCRTKVSDIYIRKK
jgi:hypothetical protein